jgi:type II secretory pathway component GspD/PulD (secretin)
MTQTKQAKRVMMLMVRVTIITNSKSLRKYLNNIPEKHEFKELQDTACWTQQTYWGKCKSKSTEHSAWEIAIYVV